MDHCSYGGDSTLIITYILNLCFLSHAGEDYTIEMERRLILSTESPSATITIDIVDDDFFEPDESFPVSLSFKDQVMIPRVTLHPRFANITIRGIYEVEGCHTMHELNKFNNNQGKI